MSSPPAPTPHVVGLAPWLPWPLSAWPWFTEPVRAERLALLRIGVALCLLADIALTYAPHTFTFFGQGGLGDPPIFAWRFQPDRATWSLLRGLGDAIFAHLSLLLWVVTSCWIAGTSSARLLLIRKNPPADDRTGFAAALWTLSLVVYCAGLWWRMIAAQEFDFLAWLVPLVGLCVACLFGALDLALRRREPTQRIAWLPLLTALVLTIVGIVVAHLEVDKSAWLARPLQSWQDDDTLLVAAMCLWIGAAFLLLIGCATRFAAVLTWTMSMSFANANSYLDNAGDTVRIILLFYLMFCPCGAVWSLDARINKPAGPVYVHPWPIRLIFVQMILIYFMNGLYKLLGPNWVDGSSLHYVLADVTLTRFSQVALPMPIELTRVLTWSVMTWEISFPLLVLWKWPRRVALGFGVFFHLGIFATMELAGFVPYALCMYLPLVPWEARSVEQDANRV